jgi:Transmembrane domain of unknown function (DUF3566)
VSNPDDASTRLSAALDEIFKGQPRLPDSAPEKPAPREPAKGARTTDDPYVLPEIVEATAESPVLPERARTPVPPPPPPPAPPPAAPVTATRPATAPAVQAPVPTTSWGDHIAPATPGNSNAGLRAPGRRPRVRRVTRVVRHIDPWSTFKLALVFSLVGYLVCLTSGVLLWQVADSTGTLDNVERWFTQFGWETFEFDGGEVFHNAWVIGLFLAVGLTGAAVLMATLFNLVSDIVGGIRVTVLEEEVVERTASSARRYVVRRPPLTEGAARWDVDDAEPLPAAPPASVDWSVDDDKSTSSNETSSTST